MSLQGMAAEDRRWIANRRAMEEMEELERRQPVQGTQRYRLNTNADLIDEEVDRAIMAEGGYCAVTPGRVGELVEEARKRIKALSERQVRHREPGWRVPAAQRDRWSLYTTEAVTFDTEWGAVTVGRSLARIYDIDGWPDAAVLETMVQQQAAREGVPA